MEVRVNCQPEVVREFLDNLKIRDMKISDKQKLKDLLIYKIWHENTRKIFGLDSKSTFGLRRSLVKLNSHVA